MILCNPCTRNGREAAGLPVLAGRLSKMLRVEAEQRNPKTTIRISPPAQMSLIYGGEPGWDRTIDPLIKSQMLYR
jgi:hypothetical protein